MERSNKKTTIPIGRFCGLEKKKETSGAVWLLFYAPFSDRKVLRSFARIRCLLRSIRANRGNRRESAFNYPDNVSNVDRFLGSGGSSSKEKIRLKVSCLLPSACGRSKQNGCEKWKCNFPCSLHTQLVAASPVWSLEQWTLGNCETFPNWPSFQLFFLVYSVPVLLFFSYLQVLHDATVILKHYSMRTQPSAGLLFTLSLVSLPVPVHCSRSPCFAQLPG